MRHAEDTLTATQVAETFNMTVFDFNAVLRDMGIQYHRYGHWNVSRLTGIASDEPLGDPDEHPARWLLLGAAMGIHECGTEGQDLFAMLRGYEVM